MLVASTACAPTGARRPSGGNRIVTPPPETAQPAGTPSPGGARAAPTTTAARPQAPGEAMSSADIRVAYQALLDTYVDPVDGGQLIQAAAQALRQDVAAQATLPMIALPLELLPAGTGDAGKDWQGFGDAYDSVVGKMPAWAADKHPDWTVLRSMAGSLHDGHTTFLTPDDVKRRTETSFAGIGVVLAKSQDNSQPLVGEVIPNSPAASSHLQRGDRILAVEGTDITGLSVSDVAQLIRGENGTAVRLKVQRKNAPAALDVPIKRAVVQVDQVTALVGLLGTAPIGYLRIRGFASSQVADNALGYLQVAQQRGIKGWIVDLRGNSGGDLRTVLAVAGGFLNQDQAVVGYEVDRQRRQVPLTSDPLDLTKDTKVVLLVDKDTASGAEIIAAALQEAKVATLIGTKTAGNVGVATAVPLADGSMLQVTNHRFVSPSGAQLDGAGVTPDVEVPMTDADIVNNDDPQRTKALAVVAQELGLAH